MKDTRLCTYFDGFNSMLTGHWLGAGIHRDVYTCPLRDDIVIKVEKGDDGDRRNFANVREWEFWNEHQHCKKIAVWLAPCVMISYDGRILAQMRVDPLGKADKLPNLLPTFLTDLKRANFGKLKGKIVCADYGFTIPSPSLRLRKAFWD
jgi:hypothetical protein